MTYLKSERIKLVKFSDRFIVPKYIEWLNDFRVNKYLCTGRMPVTKDETFVPKSDKNLMFAIMFDRPEDQTFYSDYVGTISLHDIDWISRKAEVGYMIGSSDHWGKGIGTEAVGLVVDYAFNRLNLNKINAGVVEGNAGSCKVLEKNGFKLLAQNPQDYYLEDKYYDTYMYFKLKEWHNKD